MASVLAVIGLLLAVAVLIIAVPIAIGTALVIVCYGIHRLVEYLTHGE